MELCAAHLLLARGAAAHGLRHHVGGGAGGSEENAARAAPAAAVDPDQEKQGQHKWKKNKPACHAARILARRRQRDPAGARGAGQDPSAAGRAVRHFRIDESLCAHVPALLHAITNDRDRVSLFVFGTRLTNITRQLRHRDVDVAMGARRRRDQGLVGRHAHRLGLREFQLALEAGARYGQNACLLLVSDGLDPRAGEGLSEGDAAPATSPASS